MRDNKGTVWLILMVIFGVSGYMHSNGLLKVKPQAVQPPSGIVYSIRHAKMYHNRDCKWLRNKGFLSAYRLRDAKALGYQPCSECIKPKLK
ncbi:MAG: hypothetical protein ACYC0V_16520 [Armatimonadota bacterium]